MKTVKLTPYQRFDDLCQKDGETPICRSFELCRASGVDEQTRELEFILSTGGIKRDGHEIVQNGWHLNHFRSNPSVLWAHDQHQPPIARSQKEWLTTHPRLGKVLKGRPRFIEEDKNPFADQIFRMYRDGDLSAVSVSWDTLRFERIEDEDDGFASGIRFLEQDLMEYSAVPVPADPDALITKVKRGIYTVDNLKVSDGALEIDGRSVYYLDCRKSDEERELKLMVDFKVKEDEEETPKESARAAETKEETEVEARENESETREEETEETREVETEEIDERKAISWGAHGSVPKADKDMRWNGAAARKRLRDWASGSDGEIDAKKFREGFLWYDQENPDIVSSYKGPHHDIVNGRFVTVFRGVVAAAQRLLQGAFDVPAVDLAPMRAHLGREYTAHGEVAPWDRAGGQAYERLHQLISENPESPECDALKRAAEELAVELFGENRCREPWQARAIPKGDKSMWLGIEGVLKERLGDVVSDLDELDSHIDNLMRDLAPVVGEAVIRAHESVELVGEIRSIVGLEEDVENDKFLDCIRNLTDQTVETEKPEVDDESIARLRAMEEKLESLATTTTGDPGVECESRNNTDDSNESGDVGVLQRLLARVEAAAGRD